MDEKELKQTLSLLSASLEAVADGLLVVDLQGKILNYNQRFCKMWNIPRSVFEEKVDQKIFHYVLDQLLNPVDFMNQVQSLYLHPEAESADLLEFKDGKYFERHSFPLRISDEIEGRVWSFRDITTTKTTENYLLESEERYRSIFESSVLGIINLNRDGSFIQINTSFCNFLGYSRMELMEKNIMEVTYPEDRPKTRWGVQDSSAQKRVEIEKRYLRKDGSIVWGRVSSSWIKSSHGEYSVAIIQDITERKRVEMESEKSLSLLHATLESTADGILAVDKEGKKIILYNDQFLKMWGVPDSILETIKKTKDDTPLLAYNTRQVKDPEQFINRVKELYRNPTLDSFDVFELKDGRVFERHSKPQMVENKNIGRVWSFRDVTHRASTEKRLHQLANFDALTGLPNRTLLYDRLDQAMARAKWTKRFVGVLFLDLDRFKNINDTLGHDFGDLLLKEVSRRLSTCIREGDTIARLGGDEFIFILDHVANSDDTHLVAQKILDVLTSPFQLKEQEIFVSGSIGIAVYPEDGQDYESLLKNADTAMYRAKDQGKNNYQLYSPLLNARVSDRLSLENKLRRALERDEFVLHYQPIIELATGSIVSLEALIRWIQPDKGIVSPQEFILIAEETGLINPIGNWVLRTACAQIQTWQAAGLPKVSVAVNISSRQFQQSTLVNTISNIVRTSGILPECLELEITESAIMKNPDNTAATLRELHRLGIKTSVDDFGTGYSSLAYLKHFQISCLKIDRTFIRDIVTDSDDQAIVTAITALAHSLNLKVVAEGVETKEQLQIFQSLHCDKVQGFYYCKPLPQEEITQLLMAKKGFF